MKMWQNVGAVVLLCTLAIETVWAHSPFDFFPDEDDGLIRLYVTPAQVGLYPCYPYQLFPGKADVYGCAVGVLNLEQKSAMAFEYWG